MPQIAFFFLSWTRDLLVSQKFMQRHFFFPHPPSPFPGNFCNCNSGGINSFQILGSASIVIHSMKQHLLRNQPRSDAATSRDFLHKRLQRAFTHANQLHWTARNSNWQFADMEYACGLGFFLGVCQFFGFCFVFVLSWRLKVLIRYFIVSVGGGSEKTDQQCGCVQYSAWGRYVQFVITSRCLLRSDFISWCKLLKCWEESQAWWNENDSIIAKYELCFWFLFDISFATCNLDSWRNSNLVAVKSRVLMALSKEEPEDWCDEYRPLVPWERDQSCSPDTEPGFSPSASDHGPVDPGVDDIMPSVFKAAVEESTQQSIAVVTVAVGSENATESVDEYQAIMHPDIAVAPNLGHLGNFTADLETAWVVLGVGSETWGHFLCFSRHEGTLWQ